MSEDSAHADRSAATAAFQPGTANSNPPTPGPVAVAPDPQEGQEFLLPGFNPTSAPSSPSHTLPRLGTKTLTSPTSSGGQVSAITVVALLDKLVAMIEAVQENQRRMEKRQAELEGTVRGVQGDVARLAKSHSTTATGVSKLLERSRKTGGYIKDVRERLERQGNQVKRLEANHAHLLKRNHFKVLIFQEDNEIPTTVLSKDSNADIASTSVLDDVPASPPASAMDTNHSHDEGLQTISLSSEEDEGAASPLAEGSTEPLGELHEEDLLPGMGSDRQERSRADKFKRSSLKKVDSLKKAFSKSSIEKKINKLVPPERREKIKKSFTPNHPKSPTTKSSSFRISPMTFNVKKVRDGDGEAAQPESSPTSLTTVSIPTMGGLDGEVPVAEVHVEEEKANGKEPSTSTPGSADGGLSVTEDADLDNGPTATLAEEEVLQDQEEDDEDDHEDGADENRGAGEEEEEEESRPEPASTMSAATPAVAVQQAS
ncbi:caveolae-associated protein 2a [Astyanax mexicanus]|uniref:Caveolae associated protein 2 n=1 Tax=Astyanax mexicanus TaxID=7994 RepID=A0A8B9JHQ2_ASTMX|nr:caveolae-associated protein 2a [Astyanax mexicanus]KAG9271281.1 serum deprivation-response protein [Astyanax mexicanus]